MIGRFYQVLPANRQNSTTLPSLFTILVCEMIVSILIDNLHLLFAIFVITFRGLLMNEKVFQSSRLQQSVVISDPPTQLS